ncbi:MAG: ribosomal protein S18-alanine N-acetyltransferase [Chloroflexaceae bacterium]|nr:ribosomal protein S18-alanine N-acetyltransferase [Chloroflexaceae bacterium]
MYYFIEPMKEEDIPAVQQIEAQSFPIPWAASTYRRELRDTQRCRYLVARASPAPPPQGTSPAPPRRSGFLSQLFGAFMAQPVQPNVATSAPIVGYGGLWLSADEAHVTTIAVDPAYRRRGIGELLLNGLIDQAYELGARMITLEVRVSNDAAQRLYLKYGFTVVGTRRRYYTDNGEDALLMSIEALNDPAYRQRLNALRRQFYARLQRQA